MFLVPKAICSNGTPSFRAIQLSTNGIERRADWLSGSLRGLRAKALSVDERSRCNGIRGSDGGVHSARGWISEPRSTVGRT